MTPHRIKELREKRQMTQSQLAAGIGRSKSVISRIESGDTQLDVNIAESIARVLNCSLADVLNIEVTDPGRVTGLAEDLTPYVIAPGDPWVSLQKGSRYLFTVETNVLERMGIAKGDVCVIDDSAEACAAISPLQAARVRLHPPEDFMQPLTLLRQFVPPRLLISNATGTNQRSIDMDAEDAHIVGVVVEVLRRFPASRA